MSLVIGLDLGTSGIKAVLVDEADHVRAEASRPVAVSTPHPGWSEQAPDLWCDAVADCLDALAASHPGDMAAVSGIGLSGQMLGSVLLDKADRPLRPAILWNDQRALAECRTLLERVPDIGRRTNGIPDPGLTAPKLMWLATHEPDVVEAAAMLLLPKDYVRLWLTGAAMSEPTDAGGTMLLDIASGTWDPALCEAVGWPIDRLPPLTKAWHSAGALRAPLAARWGLRPGLPVAAGAGDNMACSIGVGVARAGEAAITIGTSAVVCSVDAGFRPAPEAAMLTSAHAAPDAFLSMAVVMSATATFAWIARLTGASVAELAAEVDAFVAEDRIAEAPLCRPSLTGVRTPHNRPDANAVLTGLTPRTDRGALGYAVLEGVAFQLRECVEAQERAGLRPHVFRAVGGGARNPLWLSLIATAIDGAIACPDVAPHAAPVGAARLALAAVEGGDPIDRLAATPKSARTSEPVPALKARLDERYDAYRRLPLGDADAAAG